MGNHCSKDQVFVIIKTLVLMQLRRQSVLPIPCLVGKLVSNTATPVKLLFGVLRIDRRMEGLPYKVVSLTFHN